MQADRETITRLIKTASGQLGGILKMIEEDRYCVEISNQLLATESILRKANAEILKAHLSHCVRSSFESGSPEDAAAKIGEISLLLDKLSR